MLLFFVFIMNNVFSQADSSYTIEHYYKVRWGYADEFMALYKKNHYPVLKKLQERGNILNIIAQKPRLHDVEESRWDFKIIIVFKNAAAAFDDTYSLMFIKQLYPDQDKFKKEENHRFELLLAHWDIPIQGVDLNK